MSTSGISRRDFLNGVLIATGGAVFSGCTHMNRSSDRSSEVGSSVGRSGVGVNSDPRALRAGNLPSSFMIAHWMRDGRLSFQYDSVSLAASSEDAMTGSYPIVEDTHRPDVVIVGSGLSGLSSAYFLSKKRPGIKILILDANAEVGGNASRDHSSPLPYISCIAGAYAMTPTTEPMKQMYRDLGIDWVANEVKAPLYNYLFDEFTPHVAPGTRRWVNDVYGTGVDQMPYSPEIMRDLKAAKKDFESWYNVPGGPTEPPDESDPKYDYLDGISLRDYLVKTKGYHPAVADFYNRFSVDACGGPVEHISAHTAVNFLGSEYSPIFSFPGGNAGIARRFLRWLNPGAFELSHGSDIDHATLLESEIDRSTHRVRVRQNSIVLRADTSGTSGNSHVIYYRDGKFHKTHCNSIIIAGQGHSAQHLVDHLVDGPRRQAMKQTTLIPVAVANVVLKRAKPLHDLEMGYNQYWWGSKIWADFLVADWQSPRRKDPNRSTVLTFYSGNLGSPQEMPKERFKLMTRPFATYEDSLREDMARVFKGSDFNFDQDVSAVFLYRWGHGMVYPKVRGLFGEAGDRASAPRVISKKPIGKIHFAGQDTEGNPSVECAIASGHRAATEVLS